MRRDAVLALDGDRLTIAVDPEGQPWFRLVLTDTSRTVVRFVLEDELTPEELEESIYRFEGVLDVPYGKVYVSTYYSDQDEDDQELLTCLEQDVAPGCYRFALHATLPGPTRPNKIGGETVEAYYKRTRGTTLLPTWFLESGETEDFWVGLILQLRLDPSVKAPRRRPRTARPGKAPRKPEVCPPGILSIRPKGWKDYVRFDLVYRHDVPELVADLGLQPIPGGPVSIPVKDIVLPYWIAWVCGETHPWVRLQFDASFQPDWPGFLRGIKETRVPDGWTIDIEGMNARWTPFGHLRQVGELLQSLPDGSTVELACADNEAEEEGGRQRYFGTVEHGQWRISHMAPVVPAVTLAEMFDLVRQGEAGNIVRARDEAEAAKIEHTYRTKDYLLNQTPPDRKGLEFRTHGPNTWCLTPLLIARTFEVRFGGVLPYNDRNDEVGAFNALLDKVAEAGASFAVGELVYEGKFANFTRTDLAEIKNANHAYAATVDEWMLANGFERLGDLHSIQTFAATFRGYRMTETPYYGALVETGYGSSRHDFFTSFADGYTLTTATSDAKKPKFENDKKLRGYRLEMPGDFAERFASHCEKVESLAARHGEPVPAGDLTAFAKHLDDVFTRMHA